MAASNQRQDLLTTRRKAELIFLNVSKNIENDRKQSIASTLEEISKSTKCHHARNYLSSLIRQKQEHYEQPIGDCTSGNSSQNCSASPINRSDEKKNVLDEMENMASMKKQILKYIKISDRYMCLASNLLKSRAFHETYEGHKSTTERLVDVDKRALIELPRTKHGKPFIPTTMNTPNRKLEENKYPVSVSHHLPFVGMVRLIEPEPSSEFASKTNESRLQLAGLDIVMFDELNYRLYDQVQDFVNAFREMFSPEEWKILNCDRCLENPESQLRELYLRWAVKEAYTKALGVGLGFDFSSFTTRLDMKSSLEALETGNAGSARIRNGLAATDDQKNPTLLWDWLSYCHSNHSASTQALFPIMGQVVQIKSSSSAIEKPPIETYVFYAYPLFESAKKTTPMDMSGCAFMCIGPLDDNDSVSDEDVETLQSTLNKIEISIEWTDLQSLVAWHASNMSCNSFK